MKQLRIFTAVWNDQYLDWFEKYCLASLRYPKNAAALEGATWSFLTKEENIERLNKAVNESGIKIRDIEFMTLGPEFDRNPHAGGAFLLQGYLQEMGRCITFGAQSLTAPPDTIFGDGSIANMREMARGRDTVVFAAHVRVTPSIDVELSGPLTNAKLVGAAWRHLHRTWSDAEDGLEQINSYIAGVVWRYLDNNLYSCNHRLPTPYLINFTPEDLVFFKNQIHQGVIDHTWPGVCLIDTERMRLTGSSDAAFMVEITPEDKNIPPKSHYHADEPDLFWRNLPHNKVNRMFTVILRAE